MRIPRTFARTGWRADWLVEFSIALAALSFLTREFIFATIGVGILLVLASLGLLFRRRLQTLRREVHVTERLSRTRLHLGGCIDGDLTIRNESRLAAQIAVVTPVVEKGLSLNLSSSSNNLLRPGTTLSSRFEITAFRSGRFQISGFTLTFNDARGLFESEVTYAEADWVEVYPAISAVVPVTPLRLYGGGLQVFRKAPAGTDYAGSRQYASGDEYPRVDWKATARLRTLMVKEFHPETQSTLHILIDSGRTMRHQSYVGTKLDEALAIAHTVVECTVGSGIQVGIWMYDETGIVRALNPTMPKEQSVNFRELTLAVRTRAGSMEPAAPVLPLRPLAGVTSDLSLGGRVAIFVRLVELKLGFGYRRTGIYRAFSEATKSGFRPFLIVLTDLQSDTGALFDAASRQREYVGHLIVVQIGAPWRLSGSLEGAYTNYQRNNRTLLYLQRNLDLVLDLRPEALIARIAQEIGRRTATPIPGR